MFPITKNKMHHKLKVVGKTPGGALTRDERGLTWCHVIEHDTGKGLSFNHKAAGLLAEVGIGEEIYAEGEVVDEHSNPKKHWVESWTYVDKK